MQSNTKRRVGWLIGWLTCEHEVLVGDTVRDVELRVRVQEEAEVRDGAQLGK